MKGLAKGEAEEGPYVSSSPERASCASAGLTHFPWRVLARDTSMQRHRGRLRFVPCTPSKRPLDLSRPFELIVDRYPALFCAPSDELLALALCSIETKNLSCGKRIQDPAGFDQFRAVQTGRSLECPPERSHPLLCDMIPLHHPRSPSFPLHPCHPCLTPRQTPRQLTASAILLALCRVRFLSSMTSATGAKFIAAVIVSRQAKSTASAISP